MSRAFRRMGLDQLAAMEQKSCLVMIHQNPGIQQQGGPKTAKLKRRERESVKEVKTRLAWQESARPPGVRSCCTYTGENQCRPPRETSSKKCRKSVAKKSGARGDRHKHSRPHRAHGRGRIGCSCRLTSQLSQNLLNNAKSFDFRRAASLGRFRWPA